MSCFIHASGTVKVIIYDISTLTIQFIDFYSEHITFILKSTFAGEIVWICANPLIPVNRTIDRIW